MLADSCLGERDTHTHTHTRFMIRDRAKRLLAESKLHIETYANGRCKVGLRPLECFVDGLFPFAV